MTYSLASVGLNANSMFTPQLITVSDTDARAGDIAGDMQLGAQFLCKNPDGSQSYYTYDAERSTPGNPVLKAVSP